MDEGKKYSSTETAGFVRCVVGVGKGCVKYREEWRVQRGELSKDNWKE